MSLLDEDVAGRMPEHKSKVYRGYKKDVTPISQVRVLVSPRFCQPKRLNSIIRKSFGLVSYHQPKYVTFKSKSFYRMNIIRRRS
jgi:hypothetical protein